MCDETEFPQTQIVNDAMSVCQNESYDSTSEDENVWGKLFPNGKSFELYCMLIITVLILRRFYFYFKLSIKERDCYLW
jgi:hypothetical protein